MTLGWHEHNLFIARNCRVPATLCQCSLPTKDQRSATNRQPPKEGYQTGKSNKWCEFILSENRVFLTYGSTVYGLTVVIGERKPSTRILVHEPDIVECIPGVGLWEKPPAHLQLRCWNERSIPPPEATQIEAGRSYAVKAVSVSSASFYWKVAFLHESEPLTLHFNFQVQSVFCKGGHSQIFRFYQPRQANGSSRQSATWGTAWLPCTRECFYLAETLKRDKRRVIGPIRYTALL